MQKGTEFQVADLVLKFPWCKKERAVRAVRRHVHKAIVCFYAKKDCNQLRFLAGLTRSNKKVFHDSSSLVPSKMTGFCFILHS